MTPKEKAQQLVDKIYFSRRYKDGEDYIAEQAWIHAKECALITCAEVLGYMGADRGVAFWQQVKEEIEKL